MDTNSLPPEEQWLIDAPKDTDWEFEELFGNVEKPKPIPFPKIEIQNQGAQPITKMACGQYALVQLINAQDKIVNAINKTPKPEIQAIDCWREILAGNPNAEFVGTTLQSNLDYQRRKGNISGYAKVTSKEQIMQAIDMNQYIYTGSQTGDWESVKNDHIYKLRIDGKIVGHITGYGKYDDKNVYGINTYGPKNGIFSVSWEIFMGNFFTKYAIFDQSMTDAIAKYRARKA